MGIKGPVIDIGLRIANVKQIVNELEKEVGQVKTLGLGKAAENDANEVEKIVSGLQKQIDNLGHSKINTTTFSKSQQAIIDKVNALESRTSALEMGITHLIDTMGKADGGKFSQEMQALADIMQKLSGATSSAALSISSMIDSPQISTKTKHLQELGAALASIDAAYDKEPKLKKYKTEEDAIKAVNEELEKYGELQEKIQDLKDQGTKKHDQKLELLSLQKDFVEVGTKLKSIMESAAQSFGEAFYKNKDKFGVSFQLLEDDIEEEMADVLGQATKLKKKVAEKLSELLPNELSTPETDVKVTVKPTVSKNAKQEIQQQIDEVTTDTTVTIKNVEIDAKATEAATEELVEVLEEVTEEAKAAAPAVADIADASETNEKTEKLKEMIVALKEVTDAFNKKQKVPKFESEEQAVDMILDKYNEYLDIMDKIIDIKENDVTDLTFGEEKELLSYQKQLAETGNLIDKMMDKAALTYGDQFYEHKTKDMLKASFESISEDLITPDLNDLYAEIEEKAKKATLELSAEMSTSMSDSFTDALGDSSEAMGNALGNALKTLGVEASDSAASAMREAGSKTAEEIAEGILSQEDVIKEAWVKVFHGISNEQTNAKFIADHPWYFFTEQEDTATHYGKSHGSTEAAYIDTTKFIDLQGYGQSWQGLTFLGDGLTKASKKAFELYNNIIDDLHELEKIESDDIFDTTKKAGFITSFKNKQSEAIVSFEDGIKSFNSSIKSQKFVNELQDVFQDLSGDTKVVLDKFISDLNAYREHLKRNENEYYGGKYNLGSTLSTDDYASYLQGHEGVTGIKVSNIYDPPKGYGKFDLNTEWIMLDEHKDEVIKAAYAIQGAEESFENFANSYKEILSHLTSNKIGQISKEIVEKASMINEAYKKQNDPIDSTDMTDYIQGVSSELESLFQLKQEVQFRIDNIGEYITQLNSKAKAKGYRKGLNDILKDMNAVDSLPEDMKQLFTKAGFIDSQGSSTLNKVKGGFTNKGVYQNDEFTIIERSLEYSDKIDQLIPKLHQAAEEGISVGEIYGKIVDEETGIIYEVQSTVKGSNIAKSNDYLEATDEQIQKLYDDIEKLNKIGLFIDVGGDNINYDKDMGFSFFDMMAHITPKNKKYTAATAQETIDRYFKKINKDFYDRIYQTVSQLGGSGTKNISKPSTGLDVDDKYPAEIKKAAEQYKKAKEAFEETEQQYETGFVFEEDVTMATANFKKAEKELAKLGYVYDETTNAILEDKEKAKGFLNIYDSVTDVDFLLKKFKELQDDYDELSKKFASGELPETEWKQFGKEIGDVSDRLEELGYHYNTVSKEWEEELPFMQIPEDEESLKATEQHAAELYKQLKEAQKEFDALNNDTPDDVMSASSEKVAKLWKQILDEKKAAQTAFVEASNQYQEGKIPLSELEQAEKVLFAYETGIKKAKQQMSELQDSTEKAADATSDLAQTSNEYQLASGTITLDTWQFVEHYYEILEKFHNAKKDFDDGLITKESLNNTYEALNNMSKILKGFGYDVDMINEIWTDQLDYIDKTHNAIKLLRGDLSLGNLNKKYSEISGSVSNKKGDYYDWFRKQELAVLENFAKQSGFVWDEVNKSWAAGENEVKSELEEFIDVIDEDAQKLSLKTVKEFTGFSDKFIEAVTNKDFSDYSAEDLMEPYDWLKDYLNRVVAPNMAADISDEGLDEVSLASQLLENISEQLQESGYHLDASTKAWKENIHGTTMEVEELGAGFIRIDNLLDESIDEAKKLAEEYSHIGETIDDEFTDEDFNKMFDEFIDGPFVAEKATELFKQITDAMDASEQDFGGDFFDWKTAEAQLDALKAKAKEAGYELGNLTEGGADIGFVKIADAVAKSVEASSEEIAEEAKELSEVSETAQKAAVSKEEFAAANMEVLQSIVDSLKGLDSEGKAFENLNKLLNNLGSKKGDEKLQKTKEGIAAIIELLSAPIEDDSFISALQKISESGSNLSDIAAILKSSKKDLLEAKKVFDEINTEDIDNIMKFHAQDVMKNAKKELMALGGDGAQIINVSELNKTKEGLIEVVGLIRTADNTLQEFTLHTTDGIHMQNVGMNENTAKIAKQMKTYAQVQQFFDKMEAQKKQVTDNAFFSKEDDPDIWQMLIDYAHDYYDELGNILSITTQVRQASNGDLLKSFSINGEKGHLTVGPEGETVAANQTLVNVEELEKRIQSLTQTTKKYHKLLLEQGTEGWTDAHVQELKKIEDEYKDIIRLAEEYSDELGTSTNITETLEAAVNKMTVDFNELEQTYINKANKVLTDALDNPNNKNQEFTTSFNQELENAKQNVKELQDLINSHGESKAPWSEDEIAKLKELHSNIDGTVGSIKNLENVIAKSVSIDKLLTKINNDLKDNSAMPKQLRDRYIALRKSIDEARKSMEGLNKVDYSALEAEFHSLHQEMIRIGKTGKGMVEQISQAIRSQSVQFIARYFSLQDIIRYTRTLAQNVINIDSAITELRKVSDASNERLAQTFEKSTETAQELGQTIQHIINVTADWARLNKLGLFVW